MYCTCNGVDPELHKMWKFVYFQHFYPYFISQLFNTCKRYSQECLEQGHYISFRWTGKVYAAHYTSHTLPFLQLSLRVNTFTSGKKKQRPYILATEALVELTTKFASAWASAVDLSNSVMYCEPG